MIKLRYLSEKDFNNRLKQIQAENVQKERLEILKKEKSKYKKKFKVKLPSTSKLILLVASLLCFQIVIFCEYVMFKFQDTSAMYALIGVPASLIPVVLGYYYKAKAENTIGGIVYDTAMSQTSQPSTDDSVG